MSISSSIPTYEREFWNISKNRGEVYPVQARNSNVNFLTLLDAGLVRSLKAFISMYPEYGINLDKIVGVGGEGTVLEDTSERLIIALC